MKSKKVKLKSKKCIVAILAHADDLELCCGGTFAKYIARGYKGIYGVLSLCNSGWSKETGKGIYKPSKEIIPRRTAEAKAACKIFGSEFFKMNLMENIYTDSTGKIIPLTFPRRNFLGEEPPEGDLPLATAAGAGASGFFPQKAIDHVADLLIAKRPELVIAQTVDNNNPDHFAAAMVVYKAHVKASKSVELGPLYSGVSNIPFIPKDPDWVVDITGYEETVEKAVSCHKSQGGPGFIHNMRKFWRRWGKVINVESAEPFIKLL